MADTFTLVGKEHKETVFDDFEDQLSAKTASQAITFLASVRAHQPDMTVAVTDAGNVNLKAYADAGFATAELDTSEDAILRSRAFMRPTSHNDNGHLADSTTFARYNYTWKNLKFIMYSVFIYPQLYQFICFPPDGDETVQSNSKATDALLLAAGRAIYGPYKDYVAVFDGYWRADTALYNEVQKISWSDVILDQKMKDTISHTIEEFFDNEDRYRDLDVPWKRGIIFHGPPGNGKTISLRALMHSLISHERRRSKITLLYVKSIPYVTSIRTIFSFARAVAPCLLIIEDIDSQITSNKLSYFFNEVDGLENNDGILMIATTNHLDQLEEGLKRPSRFDRRYLFPLPDMGERVQYCEFWREKLGKKGAKVEFPEALSEKIAGITDGFSFATMKEAFVATLLSLARQEDDKTVDGRDKDHEDVDDLPLWKEMQVQVELIRKEMEKTDGVVSSATPSPGSGRTFMAELASFKRQQQQRSPLPPPEVLPARSFQDFAAMDKHAPPRSLQPAPATSLLRQGEDSQLSSHGRAAADRDLLDPFRATELANSGIPATYPARPLMAGPGPQAIVQGNCLVPMREFREVLGQADLRYRGP